MSGKTSQTQPIEAACVIDVGQRDTGPESAVCRRGAQFVGTSGSPAIIGRGAKPAPRRGGKADQLLQSPPPPVEIAATTAAKRTGGASSSKEKEASYDAIGGFAKATKAKEEED